jgi:hypothetical protein
MLDQMMENAEIGNKEPGKWGPGKKESLVPWEPVETIALFEPGK